MQKLGVLKQINPRDLWKNEERDFTPWVAENIDLLAEVIGVPFVVDQTEKRVGAYELDIFGHVEGSDAPVIIENQLTTTDHKHLGQLLTYASGLEAALVIWIATEITDEHRAAIQWLNRMTGDAVSFFLVRPEVLQIDESNPAVKFVVEASPSEFKRVLREAVEGEEAPRHNFRRRFWSALLQFLVTKNHSWAANRSAPKDPYISSRVGRSGIGVNVSMASGSRMRVEIYISDDREKKMFDFFQARKEVIEAALDGESVSWERLDGGAASRIAVYRPYNKDAVTDDSVQRRELFEWIERNLTRLREIVKSSIIEV